MNLKRQLKLFMEHLDLPAARLARQTGVSKQVISLWLAGGSPRKIDQVKKVAEVLGTTIDHLCYGDGIQTLLQAPSANGEEPWISGVFEVKIRRLAGEEPSDGGDR